MADYEDVASVEIDDGSLEGIPIKEVFMMGCSFGIVYSTVELRAFMCTIVDCRNLDRILAHLRKRNYGFKLQPFNEQFTELQTWPKEKM